MTKAHVTVIADARESICSTTLVSLRIEFLAACRNVGIEYEVRDAREAIQKFDQAWGDLYTAARASKLLP